MCAMGRRSVTRGPSASENRARWNRHRSQHLESRRGAHKSASEVKQPFGNESSSVSFSSTPKSLTTQNAHSFTMERMDFTRRWLDGNLSMFECDDKGNSGLSDFESKRNADPDLQSVGSASEEVAAITDHHVFDGTAGGMVLGGSPVSFTEGCLNKCMQKPIASKEPVQSIPSELPEVWCKRTDLPSHQTNGRSYGSPVSAKSFPCSAYGNAYADGGKTSTPVEPCFDSGQSSPSGGPPKDGGTDQKSSKRFSVALNVEGIIRMFNEKHKRSSGLRVLLVKKTNHDKQYSVASKHEVAGPSTAAIQPVPSPRRAKGFVFPGNNCHSKEPTTDAKRERTADVVLVAPWANSLPNEADSSPSIAGRSGNCRLLCSAKGLKGSEICLFDPTATKRKGLDHVHDLYDLIHEFDIENNEFTEPKFPTTVEPDSIVTSQANNNHPVNDVHSFEPVSVCVRRKAFKPVHRTKQTNFCNGMDCSVRSDQLLAPLESNSTCSHSSTCANSRSVGRIDAVMSASTVEPIWQPWTSNTLEKGAQSDEKHYDNLECSDISEMMAAKKCGDLSASMHSQQADPCPCTPATTGGDGPWMRQDSLAKSDDFEKKYISHSAYCGTDCCVPETLHYGKLGQSDALAASESGRSPMGVPPAPLDAKESASRGGGSHRPKANSLPRYLMRSLLTKLMAGNSTKHLKQPKPAFSDVLSLSLVNVTSDVTSRELQIRKSTSSALPSTQLVDPRTTEVKLLPWQQSSYSYPSSKSKFRCFPK